MHLAGEALTDARIGPDFVALPSGQQRARNAVQTRAIGLEIAPERPIKKAFRVVTRDGGVLEIELELAVNVGVVHVAQHASLIRHLLIQRRARHRSVQHELMKVSVVGNGVLNFGDDVVRGVMLEPDNGRSLHANAVLSQFARQLPRVGALQLVVAGLRRFEAHPEPGDSEFHQFLHGVFANRISGCKHGHRPRLLPFLHALQQAHGALAMQQEVLVHDKEGLHLELSFHLLHDFKQFVTAFEEVDEISLASEEG